MARLKIGPKLLEPRISRLGLHELVRSIFAPESPLEHFAHARKSRDKARLWLIHCIGVVAEICGKTRRFGVAQVLSALGIDDQQLDRRANVLARHIADFVSVFVRLRARTRQQAKHRRA